MLLLNTIGTFCLLLLPVNDAAVSLNPRDSGGGGAKIQWVVASVPSDALNWAGQKKPSSATKRRTKDPPARKPSATVKPPTFAWPIKDRKIIHKYGDRTNPTTNTVTVNPGIDISSKKGTDVRASAAGTVSLVSWLPTYGTFVIVEHTQDYRTVYANLATTSVEKGQIVKAGAKIGTVGASKAGTFLHFEIWRDTTRLDPARHLPPAKRK